MTVVVVILWTFVLFDLHHFILCFVFYFLCYQIIARFKIIFSGPYVIKTEDESEIIVNKMYY